MEIIQALVTVKTSPDGFTVLQLQQGKLYWMQESAARQLYKAGHARKFTTTLAEVRTRMDVLVIEYEAVASVSDEIKSFAAEISTAVREERLAGEQAAALLHQLVGEPECIPAQRSQAIH